jgi:hypothetical protein
LSVVLVQLLRCCVSRVWESSQLKKIDEQFPILKKQTPSNADGVNNDVVVDVDDDVVDDK